MKKLLFVITFALTSLTVSYAYPADQEVSYGSYEATDWISMIKTVNTDDYSHIHYYLEVIYAGKAGIKVHGDQLWACQFNYSGPIGVSYPRWAPTNYFDINYAHIDYINVEVQLNKAPGKYSWASARWEW